MSDKLRVLDGAVAIDVDFLENLVNLLLTQHVQLLEGDERLLEIEPLVMILEDLLLLVGQLLGGFDVGKLVQLGINLHVALSELLDLDGAGVVVVQALEGLANGVNIFVI